MRCFLYNYIFVVLKDDFGSSDPARTTDFLDEDVSGYYLSFFVLHRGLHYIMFDTCLRKSPRKPFEPKYTVYLYTCCGPYTASEYQSPVVCDAGI